MVRASLHVIMSGRLVTIQISAMLLLLGKNKKNKTVYVGKVKLLNQAPFGFAGD